MSTDPIEALLSRGKVAAAVPLLEAAVARMPEGWSPRVEHDDRIDVSFWDRGEFVAFCQETKPTKKIVWVLPSYSRYCYYLCFAAVERQDLASAARWIDLAVALEPSHSLLLSEKALILGYQGRRPEALETYRRATLSMPWYPLWTARAHRGLGFELIEEKRIDEAEKEFRRSLELEPGHPVAINELEVIADLRRGGVTGLASGLTRGGGQTEAQNN